MDGNKRTMIEERVRAAAREVPRGGSRRIARGLRRELSDLRARFSALRETGAPEGWEQWLSDNFYALEAHAKQSLLDLRGCRKRSAPLLGLYLQLEAVFADGEIPIGMEEVRAALTAANELSELGERQLEFTYTALKCVLLHAAADACAGERDSAGRERLLSYAVTGLTAVYELDFDALTRSVSAVERIFEKDPAGVYPRMAEQSRRHYRQVAARIARYTGAAESAVARDILICAGDAKGERERHVGYYLLGHDPRAIRARRRGRAALLLSWALPLALCAFLWAGFGPAAALLGYLPLVEIVRVLASSLAMRGVPAGHIPRVELTELPKTAVAVTTLLPAADKADGLRNRLEQLYFSNPAENLFFCVLADFGEDRRPFSPQDGPRIDAAKRVIEELNRRYGGRFFLFVRRRVYSPTQNAYCGWERKRGAIIEFIRFVKGGETPVACFAGDREALGNLKYLIALDADTNLSFDGARQLLAAAEHPLNRPVIGKHNTVAAGYGILTARIGTDLESAKVTDFIRIMAGAGGISSYEQECSDFYQDLFGQTVFSGKGLIDIDAFHAVVGRRFPENRVLSHDIVEGAYLRVGLLSDVELTDGMPTNALSWFTRLHRWIRGDWQNLPFLRRTIVLNGSSRPNPVGLLAKYQLLDNLRRSLTPAAALSCVVAAAFLPQGTALLLCALAFLSGALAPLLGAVRAILNGGRFALTRRYFARTLPRVFELLGQALLGTVMTAQQAVVSLDAACRALWRMAISHKNLLQWTTAAQGETRDAGVLAVLRRSWLSELIGLCLLIFAPPQSLIVKLYGALFLLYAPVAAASARPTPEVKALPGRVQRERLLSLCAQMFRFYEDYAGKENHYLPPDNVQYSPVEAVARRTSPTNIGMMLLSMLAARDLHLIDTPGLYTRVEHTLSTVEKLETYRGNLYNWYATDDLRVLPEPFVSAVDSGNFLCALVALGEGLREYAAQEPRMGELVGRVEALLERTDFSVFYNRRRKLLTIGLDRNGNPSGSHYDFLMSEARTASYYAVATRQAGRRHWSALGRAMSRCGPYAGPVSWTGTMFEYFMPHLLLPAYDGSLLGEALHYALYCQKRRARRAGVPWGISESGYFAFDPHLNYQYKAHGVQALGVKRGLDRECVVAPYATFLALPFDLDGGMKNLDRLEALGMAGRYGFYEAADFTPGRAPAGGFAVVRSYMAHHVGMSIVACANALLDNVMQKRFMRDHAMGSAREFLQEKISKDAVVYDQMKPENDQRQKPAPEGAPIVREGLSPLSPACTLLASGLCCHPLSETGNGWLRYGDCDVTRRSDDPLLHPQGILALVKACGETISATAAPFWQEGVAHRCEFTTDGASYHARKGEIELTQRFTLDAVRPVERCALTVRNHTASKAVAQVCFYFEPVLAQNSEYAAHPAFSKLFLLGSRDAATDSVSFFRRHRDGSDGLFLSAGLAERIPFDCCLRREEMTPYPEGLQNLLHFDALPFGGQTATPDGCCALRLTLTVPARGEATVTLLLSCGPSLAESAGNLAAAREERSAPAPSPLMGDSMAARFGLRLLPQMLFGADCGDAARAALAENTRGQDALWSLGISGDRPIVLYDWDAEPDGARLSAYLELWTIMRLHRLEFDLCVLGAPENPLPEGVYRIPREVSREVLTALRAAACHTASDAREPAPAEWRPAPILHAEPAEIPQDPNRFDVVGGAYLGEGFCVERVTPLPFSHVLANPSFGCLMQDASLGNTWWQNARECKLSPWRNDIATGNDGERLLLKLGEEIYDLVNGARAFFSPSEARWKGRAGNLSTEVRVTVSDAGSAKFLDVTLENESDGEVEAICAYVIEPVLGVSRQTAKYIRFGQLDGCLTLHNPYHAQLPAWMAVRVPDGHPSHTTDRAAFYAGDWSPRELLPNNDPIAGTVVRKRLPPRRRESIRFILAAAAGEAAAAQLAGRPLPPSGGSGRRSISISTPSEPLDRFINTFAPHQILAGRLWGRCAFYQCSGAYGFRDQLQDAGAYQLLDPEIAREQIARCCAVQFPEGDVLHWWHALPSETRGVRTRFSDDLLWLPYTVCGYVEATGDRELLDLEIAFCEGEPLAEGEQERYQTVRQSEEKATVFEHCVRAIEKASNFGDKGIPKIGCGDWNDGFSGVGAGGQGQSVWLGMFLAVVCGRFAPLCAERGDGFRAELMKGTTALLRQNLDKSCWDGNWYLRAFYDDGTPLGSHKSEECRIDLLSQSFAVFAGMPDASRVKTALDSALGRLVDHEGRIVKLFTPPFDRSDHNPGYIKAYPTGIRENGGQYTHAAIWLALALLEAGRAEEGWRLLDMLNPASRCTDAALAQSYKTEPYYLAADIYTHAGCCGHGGWSIYTGAAAWYYRAVVGGLLGLGFRGGALTLSPRLPESWNRFSVTVREGEATYAIECSRTGKRTLTVDGNPAEEIPLDGASHTILLTI